jgi:hypothetical protein
MGTESKYSLDFWANKEIVLILLMEQRVARDPKTGRPPTVDDRLAFGAALIRIMAESVRP